MRTKFFIPFYLLSAVVAFLCGTVRPTEAERALETVKGGYVEDGDFGPDPESFLGPFPGTVLGQPCAGNVTDKQPAVEKKKEEGKKNDAGASEHILADPFASSESDHEYSPLSPARKTEDQSNFVIQNLPVSANLDHRGVDPDEMAAMRLLWDAWHKGVAETIYTRFNTSAQMLFKHSPPLTCQVSYMVARDGRIGNVRVLQASSNPVFDTMLLNVIHSIAGNPVLEFPPGSRRQFVEKTGTFTWNFARHQSFKGDFGREPAPQIGPRPVCK